VFRGGAAFVNVDVYPLRDDRPVEGLTQADFEVFEDGTPQRIESFEYIKAAPLVIDAERRDPETEAESERLAADPRNRLFVLYVDVYNVRTAPGAYYGRKPMIDFLDRAIGPNDLIGILTPLVPVQRLVFGRKVHVIQQSLENFWQRYWMPEIDPVEEQYYSACPRVAATINSRRRMDRLFSSLEGLVARLGAIRDERKNVILFSDGWALPGPDQSAFSRHTPSLPPINVVNGRLSTELPPGTAARSECDAELARLASMDFQERFREFLAAASRANVAFHPVSPSGLAMYDRSADEARVTGDSLRTLASSTNGFAVVHTNDIRGGLARLEARQSAFYLLGYYSTNTAADGKYRKIEVRVKQPRIQLTARRGYLAPTEELVRAGAAASAAVPREPSAVDDALATLARVRSSAELLTHAAPRGDALTVIAEIGSSQTAAWRNGGEVEVTVTDMSGQIAASGQGRLTAGMRAAVVHVPIGKDRPGPWRVTVRLNGAGQLTDRIDVAPRSGQILGAPLVFRANSALTAPLRPVADFLFHRTERARFEFPILRPLDRREARLLDRRGQPLALAVRLTEADGADGTGPVLAADLGLAPLGDGDYVLEVIGGGAGDVERRFVALRVVR
jgi:VWFA-related protein